MRFASRVGVIVLACALGSHAIADDYGTAGCGLGSLVFGDSPSWFGQTCAATTNGLALNQGFAITSGTSNCVEEGKSAMLRTQENFMANNLLELSKEIARGDGDTLRAFSQTFNCSELAYPKFSSHLKQSHRKIFAAPGVKEILNAVREEISSDQELSTACPTT